MGLRSLRLPSSDVQVPGGDSFAVRGLSLQDVSILVRNHGATMTLMFDRYMRQAEEGLPPADMATMGRTLLEIAPDAAAEIIALAAGEPDAIDVVRVLPLPVQVDALDKIMGHTFTTDQDLKKVVETVIRAATGTTGLINSLNHLH
jgi:hypothetical protein